MRLEVIADNKGAVVYVLNRPEVYIGSTDTNDIVIASSEISKKHLKLIITEDQKCFVIDQGSTNGTFINDERIVPGRREEFPLLSSIRLGDKVLLTLLDKDRGDLPELPLREQFVEENRIKIADEDKTRVISLKTLQKTKTEKVRKKARKSLEKQLKKKKQVRKDRDTLNKAFFSAVMVMALAFAGMKIFDLAKKRKNRHTIVGQMKETQIVIDDTLESIEEMAVDSVVADDQLLPVAEIARHSEDVNCTLQEESFFCKRMPRGSRKHNGALNINDQLVLYLEQKEWLSKAQSLVAARTELMAQEKRPEPSATSVPEEDETEALSPGESGAVSMEMLNRIAFLIYLKEYLWAPLPAEYLGYNLYLVFYSHIGSEIQIESVLALKSKTIPKVVSRFSEDFFRMRKYDPYKIIKRLDRFYRIY